MNQHSNTQGRTPTPVSVCPCIQQDESRDPSLFPKGLKHAKSERGKLGHDLPLCFVPSKVSKGEDGEDSTLKMITIKLDQNTT